MKMALEKLLGRGDMLFKTYFDENHFLQSSSTRILISDDDVERDCQLVKEQAESRL